jgi:hypothetical protein
MLHCSTADFTTAPSASIIFTGKIPKKREIHVEWRLQIMDEITEVRW